MDIFDLKKGDFGQIKGIFAMGNTLKRLNSLGIEVNKKIEILSYSLFKSAVLIGCGSVKVGMRKRLAKQIEVVKIEGKNIDFK